MALFIKCHCNSVIKWLAIDKLLFCGQFSVRLMKKEFRLRDIKVTFTSVSITRETRKINVGDKKLETHERTSKKVHFKIFYICAEINYWVIQSANVYELYVRTDYSTQTPRKTKVSSTFISLQVAQLLFSYVLLWKSKLRDEIYNRCRHVRSEW